MGKTVDKPNLTKCPYCGKKPHAAKLGLTGNHVGNGGTLGQRIMEASYSAYGETAKDHPLSMPSRTKYSIAQAHHLICSEVVNTEDWAKVCATFGYDINCKENGAFFPADMRVACQLKIPLHRGNHSQTQTKETPDYVNAVKSLVMPVLNSVKGKEFCDPKADIIGEMNSISKEIWGNVRSFSWILTIDGKDYLGGKIGCLGVRSLTKKKILKTIGVPNKCPKKRDHGLSLIGPYFKEQ